MNRQMLTNSIKETIRITDAEESLKEDVKKKCKDNADFADIEARRTFNDKEMTALIIKYLHGFNHCKTREN